MQIPYRNLAIHNQNNGVDDHNFNIKYINLGLTFVFKIAEKHVHSPPVIKKTYIVFDIIIANRKILLMFIFL